MIMNTEQMAKNVAEKALDEIFYYGKSIREWMKIIVEQEPKTGHWIEHERNGIAHIECSECSIWFLRCHLIRNSFCPNCGAKMVEPTEEKGQQSRMKLSRKKGVEE